MRTPHYLIGVVAVIVLSLNSNMASAMVVVDQPVGPTPSSAHPAPHVGYLMVYSATEDTSTNGDSIHYYPHSDYDVFSTDGKRIKSVSNSSSSFDESPAKVILPAGTYKVRARSEKDGLMMITVIIKTGQTTTLDLDRNNSGNSQDLASNDAVRTPSGSTIGYKAK